MAQEVEDVRDAHPLASDAGLSAAFAWFYGDPLQQFHGLIILQQPSHNKREKVL